MTSTAPSSDFKMNIMDADHTMRQLLARRHKRVITLVQQKTGFSDYQILWITFFKGIILGFLLAVAILK